MDGRDVSPNTLGQRPSRQNWQEDCIRGKLPCAHGDSARGLYGLGQRTRRPGLPLDLALHNYGAPNNHKALNQASDYFHDIYGRRHGAASLLKMIEEDIRGRSVHLTSKLPEECFLSAPVHKAICLNGVTPAEVTYRGFAEALAGRAVLLLQDLEGYASDYPTNYDWETEVTAVARLTAKRGWQQFHVMGYSAGASVALGFACSFPDHVQSLSLIEPWFVDNDVSWSKECAKLLESVDAALNLPLQERFAAFLQAFTPEQSLSDRSRQ